MKKSLIALVAAPLLSLSSVAFAAEPVALTDAQMDVVTAGFFDSSYISQTNYSPVTVAQVNFGEYNYNYAKVISGNFAKVRQ